MAINNNSKKARIARARHAAAQRKSRTAPVAVKRYDVWGCLIAWLLLVTFCYLDEGDGLLYTAIFRDGKSAIPNYGVVSSWAWHLDSNSCPPPPARCSTRRSRRAIPEDSDGSHLEAPEESSHHQSRPPTPEPESPNPVMPDIETLRATRDALQAQATLAVRQSEKSAEFRQLEVEIAKLRSSLTSSVSGQVGGGGYLGNTGGMDPKAIYLLVRFPTIKSTSRTYSITGLSPKISWSCQPASQQLNPGSSILRWEIALS